MTLSQEFKERLDRLDKERERLIHDLELAIQAFEWHHQVLGFKEEINPDAVDRTDIIKNHINVLEQMEEIVRRQASVEVPRMLGEERRVRSFSDLLKS